VDSRDRQQREVAAGPSLQAAIIGRLSAAHVAVAMRLVAAARPAEMVA